jgi:hypothetical protein
MRIVWTAFLVAVVLAPPSLRAGERPVLVVLPVENEGTGITDEEIKMLTDFMVISMGQTGYTVFSPGDLQLLLPPKKAEAFLECRDRACQSEIDKDRAGDYLLQTQARLAGKRYLLSATLSDLRTSKVVKTGQQETDANGTATIEGMKKLADALRLVPMTPEEERQASMKDLQARILKLLDGWVHGIRHFDSLALDLVIHDEDSCQDTLKAVQAMAASTNFGKEKLQREIQEARKMIKPKSGAWTREEEQKIERWLASVAEGTTDTVQRIKSSLRIGPAMLFLEPFKKRCPNELEQIFKIIADKIAATGSPL